MLLLRVQLFQSFRLFFLFFFKKKTPKDQSKVKRLPVHWHRQEHCPPGAKKGGQNKERSKKRHFLKKKLPESVDRLTAGSTRTDVQDKID
jgi:hypothetical protein